MMGGLHWSACWEECAGDEKRGALGRPHLPQCLGLLVALDDELNVGKLLSGTKKGCRLPRSQQASARTCQHRVTMERQGWIV